MTYKPNLCKPCGIYSKCSRSFSHFLDQAHCRYAVKSVSLDQCVYHTEVGLCDHPEAQQEARDATSQS